MKRQVITALATPFLGGRLDVDSYLRLLEAQKAAQCDVLVAGTTAEGALLSVRERKLLMSLTREYMPDTQMWVGVSSGITKRAIREAFWAETMGANGIMICPPSFFKCTEAGFCEHVRMIKRACNLPIMLYNAPTRCGYTLWKDAVKYLADRQTVSCIKDAGSNTDYTAEISKKIRLYCGNEELLAEFVGAGATGVVSVASNVNPILTKKALSCAGIVHKTKVLEESMAEPIKTSDVSNEGTRKSTTSPLALRAKDIYAQYQQLVKLAFCELNPIPVKYMLYKMGIFRSFEMRLPLSAASYNTRHLIDEYLR